MVEHIRAIKRKVTVHFICANLMKPFNFILSTSVHKYGGADNVCLQEDCRVINRSVYMRLYHKVDNYIRVLDFKDIVNSIKISDIFLIENEVWILEGFIYRMNVRCIHQNIHIYYLPIRTLFKEHIDEIASDEFGATFNKNSIHLTTFFLSLYQFQDIVYKEPHSVFCCNDFNIVL